MFESSSIKMLKLYDPKLTFNQLICLLKVLSTKNLERFYFRTYEDCIKFENPITQSELDKLNKYFT